MNEQKAIRLCLKDRDPIGFEYLVQKYREQAIDRMIQEAERVGANAVVGIRFTTSVIMGGSAELLSYGTAVYVEEE